MSQTHHRLRGKNPYDTFKVEPKILYRSKSSIRQIGQSNKKILNKKLFLNKILNRTKSVLKKSSDYSEYMKEYESIVTKLTFKNPNIQNYPLLRKSCSDMISLKNQIKTQDYVIKEKILNNFFTNRIMISTFKEKLRTNLNKFISSPVTNGYLLYQFVIGIYF